MSPDLFAKRIITMIQKKELVLYIFTYVHTFTKNDNVTAENTRMTQQRVNEQDRM